LHAQVRYRCRQQNHVVDRHGAAIGGGRDIFPGGRRQWHKSARANIPTS
jgi:hypothetical protein